MFKISKNVDGKKLKEMTTGTFTGLFLGPSKIFSVTLVTGSAKCRF